MLKSHDKTATTVAHLFRGIDTGAHYTFNRVCVCCVEMYFSQLEIAYAILYVERFTKPLWSLFDPRALFVFTSYAFNV